MDIERIKDFLVNRFRKRKGQLKLELSFFVLNKSVEKINELELKEWIQKILFECIDFWESWYYNKSIQ